MAKAPAQAYTFTIASNTGATKGTVFGLATIGDQKEGEDIAQFLKNVFGGEPTQGQQLAVKHVGAINRVGVEFTGASGGKLTVWRSVGKAEFIVTDATTGVETAVAHPGVCVVAQGAADAWSDVENKRPVSIPAIDNVLLKWNGFALPGLGGGAVN